MLIYMNTTIEYMHKKGVEPTLKPPFEVVKKETYTIIK